jgi:hypothetical protein
MLFACRDTNGVLINRNPKKNIPYNVKEKGQKDRQIMIYEALTTKDWAIQTPLKSMGEIICCLLFTCVLIQSVTCVLRYCIGRFDISSSYDNQDVVNYSPDCLNACTKMRTWKKNYISGVIVIMLASRAVEHRF